jgi:hypothetical protein
MMVRIDQTARVSLISLVTITTDVSLCVSLLRPIFTRFSAPSRKHHGPWLALVFPLESSPYFMER